MSLSFGRILSSLLVRLRKRFIVLLIKTVLRRQLSGSSIRCSLCSDKFKILCSSLPPHSGSDIAVVVAAFDAERLFGLSTECNMKQTLQNIYESTRSQHIIFRT